MATVSGTVKDSTGAFAARMVRAYRRSDGALAGQVVSNATTGAYSITALDGTPHFAVVHDGTVVGDPDWASVVLAMRMDDTGLTDLKGHTIALGGQAARTATYYPPITGAAYSAAFDGATDYLTVSNSADWNFLSRLATSYTVRFWLRVHSYANYNALLNNTTNNVAANCYYLFNVNITSGLLSLTINDVGSSHLHSISSTNPIGIDTWKHVEHTYDYSTKVHRLFIDGALDATVTRPTGFPETGTSNDLLNIGAYSALNSRAFSLNGQMAELQIYKGVALHTAAFSAPTAQFLGAGSIGSPAENAIIFDNITPV